MDLNSFIFPAPKKRPNYPELNDHLFWVPVYQKSAHSDFKFARLSTEMHLRTEPTPAVHKPASTKLLASCIAPASNRKQRSSLIFSTREDREAREEQRTRPDADRKTEQTGPLARNASASFQQTCPAMRARINLSRLKMNQTKLVAFPNGIQLNLADRKKLQARFPIKSAAFKKGVLSAAA